MPISIAKYQPDAGIETRENTPSPRSFPALPERFPFLVDDATQEIIRPAFAFLKNRHAGIGRFVLNTAMAEAEDLKDWLSYLEHFDLPWDSISRSHIEKYRDYMLILVSPRTHERYSLSTIRRRLNTVLMFYRFANARKMCSIDLGDELIRIRAPIDRTPLAHTHSVHRRLGNDLLPDAPKNPDETVKALTKLQYQALAAELGPLPPKTGKLSPRPTRDRLWAEFCVLTGTRPDEPSKILAADIRSLSPERPEDPYGVTLMSILGKGRKRRKIEIPNILLGWLKWYDAHERSAALRKARKDGFLKPREEPAELFVNGSDSRANLGRPARYSTFSASFLKAIKTAHAKDPSLGLMRSQTKTDPDTAQKYSSQEAAFTPHCLRHTFAIWTYLSEKRAGNSEPWKLIQARLGHEHLATTTDIYLRLAGDFEALLSDRIGSHVARILSEAG